MLKLYKRSRGVTRYWEAWVHDVGVWVVVHEGRLGERGKAKLVKPREGKTPEQAIAEAAEKPRAKGYAEIPIDEQFQVVVQYRLKTWGSVEDLDKSHEIERRFNECLGWTGNGFCDGNDIGSGCLNIFSLVVDPQLAVRTMIAELRKLRLLRGAVIAARYGEEYRTLHPADSKEEFSLI
jgi:hypothetical protein